MILARSLPAPGELPIRPRMDPQELCQPEGPVLAEFFRSQQPVDLGLALLRICPGEKSACCGCGGQAAAQVECNSSQEGGVIGGGGRGQSQG